MNILFLLLHKLTVRHEGLDRKRVRLPELKHVVVSSYITCTYVYIQLNEKVGLMVLMKNLEVKGIAVSDLWTRLALTAATNALL